MNKYIEKIKAKIFQFIYNDAKLSYSQCGEDIILNIIFNSKKDGFYIDIGANNPKIQSNTYLLYLNGWKGINIDALPNSMDSFKKIRSKDINIEKAISNIEENLTYFKFENSFYNTLNESAIDRIKLHSPLVEKLPIKTTTLSNLLDNYEIKDIDFFSIDVEGLDLQVLMSNNWTKYRPKVIIIESFSGSINNLQEDNVYKYLLNLNYDYFCSTPTNAFFLDIDFLKLRFPKWLSKT